MSCETRVREFGGGRASQSLFLLLCGVWAGWGAFLSAYACLSIYMMVILAALIATGGLLAWRRTGHRIWRGVFLSAVLALPLLHLSSAWVYVWIGFLVFGLQARMPLFSSKQPAGGGMAWNSRMAWIALLGSFLLLLGLNAHALLTSAHPVEFTDASGAGISALLRRGVVYLIGIPYALLSPGLFPYFEQHGLRVPFLIGLVCVGILSLVLSMLVLRREGGGILALFGMTLSAIALMVAQGRQAESPYFLWQEKYLAFAFVWSVLLVSILWQRIGNALTPEVDFGNNRKVRWFLQGSLVLLVGYLGMQLGVDMMGKHARHLHVGRRYWAEVSMETRAAIISLRERHSHVEAPGEITSFPDLPSSYIQKHFPILGPYRLSDFTPFLISNSDQVQFLPVDEAQRAPFASGSKR